MKAIQNIFSGVALLQWTYIARNEGTSSTDMTAFKFQQMHTQDTT